MGTRTCAGRSGVGGGSDARAHTLRTSGAGVCLMVQMSFAGKKIIVEPLVVGPLGSGSVEV